MSERKTSFIFGINPVVEKLRHAPADVHEIMIAAGSFHTALRFIVEQARHLGLPIRSVNRSVLARISGSSKHQGVVAKVAGYEFWPFDALLREASSDSGSTRVLVVDGVTDPRNLGALLRTAEGAGVRHVVIPEHRAAGITPTVAKSSGGAINYLQISRVTNLRRALAELKEGGFWAVGLDVGARQSLYGGSYPRKVAIVVGSEGHGIRSLIRRECDLLVGIPMRGRIASLNVAVATGILLYELIRQEDTWKTKAEAGSHSPG
jgi:23S rRNA (guanosine2251-2'-O)-methyltransferase